MSFPGQSYGSEGPRSPNSELQQDAMSMLLAEIRSLRVQLEKSIQTNNALRIKLEEQLGRPLSSPSQSPSRSQVTVIRQLNFSEGKGGDDAGSVSSARGKKLNESEVSYILVCSKSKQFLLIWLNIPLLLLLSKRSVGEKTKS